MYKTCGTLFTDIINKKGRNITNIKEILVKGLEKKIKTKQFSTNLFYTEVM